MDGIEYWMDRFLEPHLAETRRQVLWYEDIPACPNCEPYLCKPHAEEHDKLLDITNKAEGYYT